MSRIQRVLLELVRAGMERKVPCADDFPLTNVEWQQLYFNSLKQTVQGISYDGICQLPAVLCPPENIMQSWRQSVQEIEHRYLKHLKAINYLTVRCEVEAGLTPVVLKGLGLASYYPSPNHRVVGDIDLFFGGISPSEQINLLMEKSGMIVHRENGESLFMMNDIVVENHGRLIDSHNFLVKEDIRHLLQEQVISGQACQTRHVAKVPIKILAPIQNNLLLMAHSLKHTLNEGIGLRQLCDVVMLLRAERNRYDGEVLRQTLKDWGIYRWANLVYCFCVEYLGLSAEELPYRFALEKYNPEVLMSEVWQSGNLGQMDERMAKRPATGDSVFTAKRIYWNSLKFMKYAPYDAAGYSLGLTWNFIKEKLLRNNK